MWFRNTIYFILRHRLFFLLLMCGTALAGAWLAWNHIQVDNSVSIWFLEDNPDYKAYLKFQEERGADEIIIAMIPADDALDAAHLKKLRKLHEQIDSLPFVDATFSMANARYPIYSNGRMVYRPIYSEGRSVEQIDGLLKALPAIRKQLMTDNRSSSFFYVQLEATNKLEGQRNAIIAAVKEQIQSFFDPVYLSGQPILNEAFNASILSESSFFAILTVAAIFLLLFFLLPHWRYLPLGVASVALPVSILMGMMLSSGYSLNMISMLIPTILMVYSVSDVVHIINIYHQHRISHPEQESRQQIAIALEKSLAPCFYTTLTTIIGYVALFVSPLPAFKVMGFFTFLGLALAFVMVYIISAVGLSYTRQPEQADAPKKVELQALVRLVNGWTQQYNTGILIIGSLIGIAGICALPFLVVNTDSVKLLREGQAKADLQRIEDALGGNARFQINITRRDGQSMLNEADLRQLADFQEHIAEHPQLATPISVINFRDFLKERTPAFMMLSPARLPKVIGEGGAEANAFFSLFAADYSEMSIAANVAELGTKALEALLADIRYGFEEHFGREDYQLKVHGFLALFAQLNHFILQTQLWSFGLAFLFAFGVLIFFVNHLQTSILALLPNILPISMAILIMVLLHIDLDASNAMLAPIMLGVAMDDTIHLMNSYKNFRKMGMNVEDSVSQALAYTGGALFSTTISLVCGFLIVGLSGVASVSTFGLLCAFTIIAALFADVIFLPALIRRFGR
jgi:predicted RND superfamily exporter protein